MIKKISHGKYESKRRALGNYFSERICNMFLISKSRGDRDLHLCVRLEVDYFFFKKTSPGRMAETPGAGLIDFA